ncbi:hypothetical protein [Pseudoduganella sp. OTU4001]|uniref:hypothetical protein n=1 Tax=Pseudoduganella sp. OTU4001 TaxID=3043854 RepID=UPI00313B581E
MRRPIGLCIAALMPFIAITAHAAEPSGAMASIEVRHVAPETWRVEYRFPKAVKEIRLDAVGDFRQKAWRVRSPGLKLAAGEKVDVISAGGKPFKAASIEITRYDGRPEKNYAPFNRFSDGGTAMYLGHLQGEAMRADIRLAGLQQENVIAPPQNRQKPGGERGYAYFGPAQAVQADAVQVLVDPKTPDWARETLLDAGAKVAQYYEKAYQRPLQEKLFITVSIGGFEGPGISMNGGAVLGQLAYHFSGAQMIGDHPKKREMLARLVAHEMAHIWQMSTTRGGVGESDPWIHEGGAEAMALDAVAQTGIASAESVAAYRAAQTATCDKLGDKVDSYAGIYACGLARFERLGVGIVPLWRAMMAATEATGDTYSEQMIRNIAAGTGSGG